MRSRYVSFVTYLLNYFADIKLLKCEKAIFVLQNAFRADQRLRASGNPNKIDAKGSKNTSKTGNLTAPIMRTSEKIQIRAFQQPGFVEALADYFVDIIPELDISSVDSYTNVLDHPKRDKLISVLQLICEISCELSASNMIKHDSGEVNELEDELQEHDMNQDEKEYLNMTFAERCVRKQPRYASVVSALLASINFKQFQTKKVPPTQNSPQNHQN